MPKTKKGTSRREFLKTTAMASPVLVSAASAQEENDRLDILSALGDTLIPSRPGKPGYRDLEPHGITRETGRFLQSIGDDLFAVFNRASGPFFAGRAFVALEPEERAAFLRMLISGERFEDKDALATCRRIYRLTRIAVFRIFYSNFPENRIPRDAQGLPILKPGDQHQVTTPNSRTLVTGWDIAGYRGPLTWEQEESRRNRMKQIHWHQDVEDLVIRYRPLPSGPGRGGDQD